MITDAGAPGALIQALEELRITVLIAGQGLLSHHKGRSRDQGTSLQKEPAPLQPLA